MTGGEWVRDTASGFDRGEKSVVMFLGCGMWMNMSCVSKSIIQHDYNKGSCLFFLLLPRAAMFTVCISECYECISPGEKKTVFSFKADQKSFKM